MTRRSEPGLTLAVVSAMSFALSGPLARGLLDAGWSPGAVVMGRLLVAALVVLPIVVRALRGRWGALRRNLGLLLFFGAVPVAGTQFAYFSAVQRMDVGPALLIEYTAPAAVVVWLWLRHGERPGPLTIAGAGLATLGLILVLDLVSGGRLAPVGVLWALIAMAGVSSYFVLAAKPRDDLPPVALAGTGLVIGTLMLAALGATGILPMHATPPRRSTPTAPSRGGSRCSASGSSRPGSPTAPGSPPACGSAHAWHRSSPCSKSSPP